MSERVRIDELSLDSKEVAAMRRIDAERFRKGTIDVIIPTCKSSEELLTSYGAPLVDEVHRTAGCPVNVIATCKSYCAAKNRNLGLDQAISDPRIMIDDDIELMQHGWVAKMIEVMQKHLNCVMLTVELFDKDGNRGLMAGGPPRADKGVSVVSSRKLLTACIAIRKWPDHIRFDEAFIGSGFEDDDISAQLRKEYPDGTWMICHDTRAVHCNEMKGQAASFEINKRHFQEKWGVKW